MNTLGMIDEDVELVNIDKQEQVEEELEKKRNTTFFDKKKSQKALKILGFDPSRSKVSAKLGLDEEVIKTFMTCSDISRKWISQKWRNMNVSKK
jgi:hypothetical protein